MVSKKGQGGVGSPPILRAFTPMGLRLFLKTLQMLALDFGCMLSGLDVFDGFRFLSSFCSPSLLLIVMSGIQCRPTGGGDLWPQGLGHYVRHCKLVPLLVNVY